MKIIKILFLFICLFSTTQIWAQEEGEERKGFDKSRLFFGGNFGLSFGDFTFINISPQVGYRINRYLAAGVGVNGQYTNIKTRINGQTIEREEYGVAGMNVFARAYPINQIFVQVQPELNYIWGNYKYYLTPPTESTLNAKILPSMLIGAGGALPLGQAGSLLLMLQYDVLHKNSTFSDPGTPYGSRIFYSVGFNFGM